MRVHESVRHDWKVSVRQVGVVSQSDIGRRAATGLSCREEYAYLNGVLPSTQFVLRAKAERERRSKAPARVKG